MTKDLLDLLTEAEHAADPRSKWVHVCLPSMGYVCGGSIVGLPDGGPGGHMTLGANERDWPRVTCPHCRAPGRREISRIVHRQQKPVEHVCDDDCYWTKIPAPANSETDTERSNR